MIKKWECQGKIGGKAQIFAEVGTLVRLKRREKVDQ
jgi:hypothetical protein